jgi:hypothetical protein
MKAGPILFAVTVAVIVMATFLGSMFAQAPYNSQASETVSSPADFVVKDISLQIPQNQQPCQGPFCQSWTELSGTVHVDANSPLSCIDMFLNNTPVGSNCWNIVSTAFTVMQCSGSGNGASCTDIVSSNTNLETNRTFAFMHLISSGSSGIPKVVAGRAFLITLVAQFEGGNNETTSATVVASASSTVVVSTVSVTASISIVTSDALSKTP